MSPYIKKRLEKILKMKEEGQPLTTKSQLRIYYNHKYPEQRIIYWGRTIPTMGERIPVDVRTFITPDSELVKDIVKSFGKLPRSIDERAELIQNYIVNNFTYVYDKTRTGSPEYWQFPFESIYLKTGDCEDGAILTTSLMIAAGIPEWRVRVGAGLVKTGQPTAPTGGHAYCTYLRESDNRWIVLDWCYLPDMSPIAEKKTLKENENYVQTWFSFNHLYAWGNESFEFNKINEVNK